jgi:TonB family protein
MMILNIFNADLTIPCYMKKLLLLFACSLFAIISYAQKKDTIAFYMDKYGVEADSVSKAVAIRTICTTEEVGVYLVKDFYMSGKPKLICKSLSDKNLYAQGSCVQFYPNGKKKSITNYEKGQQIGEDMQLYPNGKPYTMVKHVIDGTPTQYAFETKTSLIECRDSTGNLLAQDGKGTWIKFDENFNKVCEGHIENGLEEGEWTGTDSTGVLRKGIFNKGEFVSGDLPMIISNRVYMSGLDRYPSFSGKDIEFSRYLARSIRYPKEAFEKKIQGRIILTFIVEKDGSLTDFKVLRGLPGGLTEEALRAVKSSPKWLPGRRYGLAVRTQFSVPVAFAIAND